MPGFRQKLIASLGEITLGPSQCRHARCSLPLAQPSPNSTTAKPTTEVRLSLASLTTLDMCRSKTPPVPLSELFLSAPKSDSCCWLRAESQALFLSDLKPQSCPASELFLFWHAGEASLGASQGGGKRHLLPPMTLNDTRPRCHGPLIEID